MKTLPLALATFTLFSLNARAGQESIGGGLCSYANVVCQTAGDELRDGAVLVCLFGEDQAHAYVSIEKHGNGERHDYQVSKQPVPPHFVGGGETFEGQGFNLHIKVGTAPREEGIYSELSLDDARIKNKVLFCKFQQR